MGPPEGTIPANDHQTIDTQLLKIGMRLLPPLVLEKFLATGRFQDCSPALNDVGHASRMHRHNIILDHPTIPPHNTEYLHSIINTGTNNGTDGRIHPRGIAPGSEYANFSDFVFHQILSSMVCSLKKR